MSDMPDDKSGREVRPQAGAAARKPAPAKEPYWRSFPALENLLEQERPPLLDRIKGTCGQLDSILKSGSPQEKARAQDAMTAYARALELYQELVKRRDEIFAQTRNRDKAPHDK
jgi:hypothetical protein